MWDVAVIGGGPSGMMAAGRAAACGARVILLEKNPTLGKKLLITGGGRCNVTNAEFDTKKLLAKYGDAGKFLASPFSQWDAAATIAFFEECGVPIKIEAEQRAFPTSNSARSIYEALIAYMQKGNVAIRTSSSVVAITHSDDAISAIKISSGEIIEAKTFILAAGGISRPETGSNGDGFKMLRTLKHTVDESGGALVPIALAPTPLTRAAAVSLAAAKITVLQDGEKQSE
jgi:predicted Rossmann fold flavoprotein